MSSTKATTIPEYNALLSDPEQAICMVLEKVINDELQEAESKIWHGGPVWFINGNPVVGYWARKKGIQLLFWSGQSFEEAELEPEGNFKAAQKVYFETADINETALRSWLKKSRNIQWDYKNIVKKKGKLELLPS